MKKNNLLQQFTTIGLGTVISLALGFFNVPIITRIVNPGEYGQFSLFQTYSMLALSILYLGMDQSLIRYFYEYNSIEYKQSLLRKILKICTISITIASFIFLILFSFRGSLFGFSLITLILFIAYIFIMMFNRFSTLVIRLQFHSKLYSMVNILQKVFYLGLAIPLVYIFVGFERYGLILALIISNLLVIVLGLFKEKEIWFGNAPIIEHYKIDEKRLIRYSLPFILSLSITSIFEANDKLFLSNFTSLSEVGVYSSATSIIALLNIVQTTFNTVWSPAAIEHYVNEPEDTDYHLKGNQMITVVMFLAGLSLILFKDVFAFFLGSEYRAAAYTFPGLVFGPMMYTISETTVIGITVKEKSHMHILVALGALIVGVIGNSILVPNFGGQGAALATGFSYIIFFSLRTHFSNKLYYVDFNLKKFYLITILAFLYAIYNTFNSFNIISLIFYFLCISVLFFLYRKVFTEIFEVIFQFVKSFK